MADTLERQKELEQEFASIHHQLVGVGIAAVSVLCVGATFFHFEQGLKWLDAFYFCTITLTTVGYGDITPVSDAAKLFTMFYVLIGIGVIATFANLLIKQTMIKREIKRNQKDLK